MNLAKSMRAIRFGIGVSVFFLLFIFPGNRAFGAFGISPPNFNAVHVVPGATYSQAVYLVQDQASEDLPIHAIFDVPDSIKPWLSLDRGPDFTIPKGVHQFPIVITVKIPSDTGLGVYGGTLSFASKPSQTGQVTIALGVQVGLNIVVGNDVYRKFSIPVIKMLDIEEGWNPKVYAKFNNEGNVPETVTGATYELRDQYNAVRLGFVQKGGGFPTVAPFTQIENTFEFPIDFHLSVGQYWGTVTFYEGDTPIATQHMAFDVLQTGSLASPLWTFVNTYKLPLVALAIVLVGGVVAVTIARRKVIS